MGNPVKSFRVKMVKSLFDIIALKYMRDNGGLAGYEFMSWIQENRCAAQLRFSLHENLPPREEGLSEG